MENVVLTVHLILAVLLIGVVLLQRSEGGGLGMGSGGGGVMTGRQAANALSKATWFLAIAFLVTSLGLTIIAARNSSNGSIIDQLDLGGASNEPATSLPGIGEYVPPPSAAGQPILPPVPGSTTAPTPAPAPATPAAAASEGAAQSPVTPPAATNAPATPASAPAAPAQN